MLKKFGHCTSFDTECLKCLEDKLRVCSSRYRLFLAESSEEELELEEEKKRVKKVDDYYPADKYSARFVCYHRINGRRKVGMGCGQSGGCDVWAALTRSLHWEKYSARFLS